MSLALFDLESQNVSANWSQGNHVKRFVVLLIAAVLSFTIYAVPVHAKHQPNPEARAAQKRAKQQQKEVKKHGKAQRKDSKRLKSNSYTTAQ